MDFALGAFLLSLISFFIAAGSVVVSIRQHRASKEHNKLSFQPLINIIHEKTTEYNKEAKQWVGILKIVLINNGIGPALVERFDLFVDGTLIDAKDDQKWEQALWKIFGAVANSDPPKHFGYGVFNLTKGYCIPSRDHLNLFTIRFTMDMSQEIQRSLDRSRAVLIYRSLYKDTYTYDTDKVKRGEIELFE
jgi:hypothetical protein